MLLSWFKGVKRQYVTLFLDVSKEAHILAGIKVKPTDTVSLSSDSDSDSSDHDLDSDYEGPSSSNHQKIADSDMDASNHQLEGHGTSSDDNGTSNKQEDGEGSDDKAARDDASHSQQG